MSVSVRSIDVAADDPAAALTFYSSLFDPTWFAPAAGVDAGAGFRGVVLSAIVPHANDVRTVVDGAAAAGATVIKEPTKRLFGEYAGAFRAPDGVLWKITAASRKDRGEAALPIRPIETAIYLGVASPKASKRFYEALGMRAEHDYGDTFVGFHHADGESRLGLMTRAALAKDAAVDGAGSAPSGAVPVHIAGSREEADRVTAAAATAGGTVVDDGFVDPDGHRWRIAIA